MKHPKERWVGVPIIVTSNSLPKALHKPIQGLNEEQWQYEARINDFEAFHHRIKFTEMHNQYKNSEKFPYTADELAIYLKDYLDTKYPILEQETLTQLTDLNDTSFLGETHSEMPTIEFFGSKRGFFENKINSCIKLKNIAQR